MTRRRSSRLALVLGALLVFALVVAPPAMADNCSGFSDCSTAVKIGLIVAGVILLALLLAFIGEVVMAEAVVPAIGAIPESAALTRLGAFAHDMSAFRAATGPGNCGRVAMALDARLGGNMAAVPLAGDGISALEMNSLIGNPTGFTGFGNNPAAAQSAFRALEHALSQPGARAIVGFNGNAGSRGVVGYSGNVGGPYIGHAFNAVNEGGRIWYVDAMTGRVGSSVATGGIDKMMYWVTSTGL